MIGSGRRRAYVARMARFPEWEGLAGRRRTPEHLLLGSNPEGLHLSVEIAPLESQQFRGARDVSAGVLELLQDVLAFGRFAHVLQASEPAAPFGLAARTG